MLENAPERPPEDAPDCPYCDEHFPTERLRDLHRGLEHYEDLDPGEIDAYEEAYLAEEDDLRTFRIKAAGWLVLLYFLFLFAYSAVP